MTVNIKRVSNLILIAVFLLMAPCFLNTPVNAQACNTACGSKVACNTGLTCTNGKCLNASCPADTNGCDCGPYVVQGYKVGMPGNQTIAPFAGQTVYLDGGNPTTAEPYFFTNLYKGHTISVSAPAGSSTGYTLCYNSTSCHTGNPTPGTSVTIDANQAMSGSGNPFYYADLWWHYTPQTPNCENVSGPTSVISGDTVTYSASYLNGAGQLTALPAGSMTIYNTSGGCLSGSTINGTQISPNESYTGPGTYHFNWVAGSAASYTAYCRAWSDWAECRGGPPGNPTACVDGPPRYACLGTNNNGATDGISITVSNPGPWYKVKDTSFYKLNDVNVSVAQNVTNFSSPADSDDNSTRNIIIGEAGVGSVQNSFSPGPSYNPIPISAAGWVNSSYSFNQPLLSSFINYVKSRKAYTSITTVDSSHVVQNTVNIATQGDITLNDDSITSKGPFVLIVRKVGDSGYANVTINAENFNNNTSTNNPKTSIAIIANNISFGSNVTHADGIFIANGVASYTSTNGLKIKGNLISENPVSLVSRTNNTSPSLFVVVYPLTYINLLPYLSTDKYNWQQLQ